MNLARILRIAAAPFMMVFERLAPERYARFIGIRCSGFFRVYGRVHWGTEPWIISLGNNVHISNNVTFVTHDGGTLLYRRIQPDLEITKPITIGDDVYIGVNSTILPGVRIGNNVIIGACSVVTRDIPDNSVAVGNPARVIKSADEYFRKVAAESLKLGHLKGKGKTARSGSTMVMCARFILGCGRDGGCATWRIAPGEKQNISDV